MAARWMEGNFLSMSEKFRLQINVQYFAERNVSGFGHVKAFLIESLLPRLLPGETR